MKIKMYLLASNDWTAQDVKADKLTHLIISFARIGNDFRISDREMRISAGEKNDYPLPDYVSSCMISKEKWDEIAKIKAGSPSLKILAAIGGWGADGFSDMASTPVTRQVFADSVLEYVTKHKLDGIDIDWEFPAIAGRGIIKTRQSDRENFTALIKTLREKLGPEKEISFCASPSEWFFDGIELYEILRYADSINIMTYDMAGPWDTETRHHTNLYSSPKDPLEYKSESIDKSVGRFLSAGVPPEMLSIGYAAYGREFRGVSANNQTGLYQKFVSKDPYIWRGGTIAYSTLEKYYINKNGYARYWDDYSQAPYLYSEEEKNFISYDDCESVRAKARYARENKVGGIICWEYTCDKGSALLSALYDEISKEETK